MTSFTWIISATTLFVIGLVLVIIRYDRYLQKKISEWEAKCPDKEY
jgi:hypothetical protein